MSDHTNIEWCDSTFNPWIGCTKVSPACDHCYAERLDGRGIFGGAHWGSGVPRKRTSAANWRKPVAWNAQEFVECPACGWRGEWREADVRNGCCPRCNHLPELFKPARRRVFCASLADMLDNESELEWFVDALDLWRICGNIDWLVLTKRIGNLLPRLREALVFAKATGRAELAAWIEDWLHGRPPANVWIGATICNQQEADRDIPKLLAVPAAVRFLSIEPLLGPIDIRSYVWPVCGWWKGPHHSYHEAKAAGAECGLKRQALVSAHARFVDWIIAGGESGPQARPSHPDWFRSLRDQCKAAGVPFLFKQHGEWIGVSDLPAISGGYGPGFGKFDHCSFDEEHEAVRVGKKAAGRLLDGVTHNGFPESRA